MKKVDNPDDIPLCCDEKGEIKSKTFPPLPAMLDGGTATSLIPFGLTFSKELCPEKWMTENLDKVKELQERFILAGSEILYTPTFGANRAGLKRYDLDHEVERYNKVLAEVTVGLAKAHNGNLKRSDKPVYTAGDISMTGLVGKKGLGSPLSWDEFKVLVEVFKEQACILKDAGVDFIVCETLTTLTEARIALIGAKQAGLPVMVTLTYTGDTVTDWDFLSAVISLQSLGAAAVGLNCSSGPDSILEGIEKALPHAKVPLIAKPSAFKEGEELSPAQFVQEMEPLLTSGASLIGGCCGATPEHMAILRGLIDARPIIIPSEINSDAVCVEGETFFLTDEMRISQPIICDSNLEEALIEAEAESNTALVLISCEQDVENLIAVGFMSRLPIMVKTDNPALLEEVLARFDGRLMVDSICEIEPAVLEEIVSFYGGKLF